MSKSFKYVSEFEFPSDKGYSGSAGQTSVKGYCRGGKVMKKADGGIAKAQGAIRNERKEIQRVEAKRKDAGQEIKRVRSEMAYDKNVVKDGQRPMRGQRPIAPLAQMAQNPSGYCGGGKVKKADGGAVKSCKTEVKKGVHKHEEAMHPNRPLTKMAKGGFNSTPLVGKKQEAKIGKVMGEYKSGDLHSGSKEGPTVKGKKQALAIALSEARKLGKK